LTSVSLCIKTASNFSLTNGYPAGQYNSYIISLIIPTGVRIIPVGICSNFQESEILILNQGQMRFESRKTIPHSELYENFEYFRTMNNPANFYFIEGKFVSNKRLPV
jgi:hypothetical protein